MTHHFFSDADMKQIAIWIFVLVFVSMFPFVCVDASADPCDSAIFKTTDKKDELAYRRFSNRCEGFYGAKVANPAFKVVGLTIGSVTYNMDAAEIIKISVPNHRKRTIRIRAEAIPSKTYYRMDAILVGDQKLEWPIKDILLKRPEELASGKIAVIGWIGKGGKKVFVPLLAESSTISSGRDRQVHLYISASSDLADFKWRAIMSANDRSIPPGSWNDPLDGNRPVRTGQSIIIQLTQNATGLMDVELAARIKNTRGWITHFIKLDLGD